MNDEKRFAAAGPNIAHENFGDEVIVVNLERGIYYGMAREAGLIWRGVVQGDRVAAIVAAVRGAYAGEAGVIDASVRAFLGRLQAEGLIVPTDEPVAGSPAPAPSAVRPQTAFVEPLIEIHNDMQDLLLLDPIHEVDPTGWPRPGPPPVADGR